MQDVKEVARQTVRGIYERKEEIFIPWFIKYFGILYYLVPTFIRDRINSWQSNCSCTY